MKKTAFLILFVIYAFSFQACEKQEVDLNLPKINDKPDKQMEIYNFIWSGLNEVYYWQAGSPNLQDNLFKNVNDKISFFSKYATPEDLFNSLLVSKDTDRFSWIVKDYTILEKSFQGSDMSNGMFFELQRFDEAGNVLGVVCYTVPNSDAETKGVKRGDIFTKINGQQITMNNFKKLLFDSDNYTAGFVSYNSLTNTFENSKNVTLVGTELNENPILVNKVIQKNGHKIGYLMYNGFYSSYDSKLNEAFGYLKSQGITDLVLDLRYNRGGYVSSAVNLASMITGNYTGQPFVKTKWNAKIQSELEKKDPNFGVDNFTNVISNKEPINSLGMNKIYILTTKTYTASASELIINGLKPYISVIEIGDGTVGKDEGSITLYDSPNFSKAEKVNPNHKYAIQPIAFKTFNANNEGNYSKGILPAIFVEENPISLGVLGDETEPLLNEAIKNITGYAYAKQIKNKSSITTYFINDSKTMKGYKKEMHIELNK